MPKFEDKFVHFRWSDELEGEMVFYADDILTLMNNVASRNVKSIVTFSGFEASPFVVNDDKYATASSWRFVYYDPNYETKLAYEQGKKIECKRKGDAWGDLDWYYTPTPSWLDSYEYRIKPEGTKLVTNRELARWLAEGNGEYQMRKGDQFSCFNVYSYDAQDANEPTEIPCVRKWNDSEWHEPTREYLGL